MRILPFALAAAVAWTTLRAEELPDLRTGHGLRQSDKATTGKPDGQSADGGQTGTNPPLTAPLDIRVPAEPWAFRANDRWNLVYELHIANIGSEPCVLKQISVRGAGESSKVLVSLAGKDLEAAIAHPWVDESSPATIGPASLAVVFMWVSVDGGQDVPAALSHTVTMKVGSYPEDISIAMAALNVNRRPVPVITPPLRGADWGAAHGPSNASRHRRGLLTIEGRSYIAERYAIDWVRITPAGEIHTGDGKANREFPGYGAEVLAVADGTIEEATDGVPENAPGLTPAAPITLRTICGNHLVEKIGEGLYASYCHLQPGIKLTPGSRVSRGQVLGHVGNTGSSDAPHLHFQICDAPSTLACEGVPYAFVSFGEEHKDFSSAPGAGSRPDTVHLKELPTDETLVDFR